MRVEIGMTRPNDETEVMLWLIGGRLPAPLRDYLHRTLVDADKLNPGSVASPPPGFTGSVRASSILQHLRSAHAAHAIPGGEVSVEPVILMPDETPIRCAPVKGSRSSPFSAEESGGEEQNGPSSPASPADIPAGRLPDDARDNPDRASDDERVPAPKLSGAKKSRYVMVDTESDEEVSRGHSERGNGAKRGKLSKELNRKRQAQRLRFFAEGASRPMRPVRVPSPGPRFTAGWPGPPELPQRRGPPPYERDRPDADRPRAAVSWRRDQPAREFEPRHDIGDREDNTRRDRRRSQSVAPAWQPGYDWRHGR